MKRLQPIRNRVLIQLEYAPTQSGSIYLLENSSDPESIGRVLEVGKDCHDLQPGSRVYVKTNHGTGMSLGGRKCVMLDYKDVLAIIG